MHPHLLHFLFLAHPFLSYSDFGVLESEPFFHFVSSYRGEGKDFSKRDGGKEKDERSLALYKEYHQQ